MPDKGTCRELGIVYQANFQQCNEYERYIEDFQFFGMNMPFISLSEAKNAYFMSGEASRDEINGIFKTKI